jgi:hypothetical protein
LFRTKARWEPREARLTLTDRDLTAFARALDSAFAPKPMQTRRGIWNLENLDLKALIDAKVDEFAFIC